MKEKIIIALIVIAVGTAYWYGNFEFSRMVIRETNQTAKPNIVINNFNFGDKMSADEIGKLARELSDGKPSSPSRTETREADSDKSGSSKKPVRRGQAKPRRKS